MIIIQLSKYHPIIIQYMGNPERIKNLAADALWRTLKNHQHPRGVASS